MCDHKVFGYCDKESDFKTKDLGGNDVFYCAGHLIYHVRVVETLSRPPRKLKLNLLHK